MAKLVAGVAFINRDKKALTVSNCNGSHVFIGGKVEKNERPIDALKREFREELPRASIKDVWFYQSFSGKNRRDEDIEIYIFMGEVAGDLTPGGELTGHEIKWVGFDEFQGSSVMRDIMRALKIDGYII